MAPSLRRLTPADLVEPGYQVEINTKEKQVQTLARVKQYLKILTHMSYYSLHFTIDSKKIKMEVELTADFPEVPPYLSVYGLKHDWVKVDNVLRPTTEKLQFTADKRLGAVLEAIIIELKEDSIRKMPIEKLALSSDLKYIKINTKIITEFNGYSLGSAEAEIEEKRQKYLLAKYKQNLAKQTRTTRQRNTVQVGANDIDSYNHFKAQYEIIKDIYDLAKIRARLNFVVQENNRILNKLTKRFQFGNLPIEDFFKHVDKYTMHKTENKKEEQPIDEDYLMYFERTDTEVENYKEAYLRKRQRDKNSHRLCRTRPIPTDIVLTHGSDDDVGGVVKKQRKNKING